MDKIKVLKEDVNQRLDHFLSNILFDFSRSQIQNFIKKEYILVNEEASKNNYRLREDDIITVDIIEEELVLEPLDLELDVVYEDDDLMIVNKPKGLIVHPSESSLNQKTLVHALLHYTDDLSDLGGEHRPGIVHRLDKDTSGLMIVAKNNKTHELLGEMLRKREVTREYLALCHHAFKHEEAIIDAPIGRDPNNRQKMKVTHINAKEAKTRIKRLELIGDYTLMKCTLDTGRTHQIRVHLEYIKHPIVGDKTYSYKNTLETEGQCLHAYHLAFKHPITNEELSFTHDVPAIFLDTLKELRRINDAS